MRLASIRSPFETGIGKKCRIPVDNGVFLFYPAASVASTKLYRFTIGAFFLCVAGGWVGAQDRLVFSLVDVALPQQAIGVVAVVKFIDTGHFSPPDG